MSTTTSRPDSFIVVFVNNMIVELRGGNPNVEKKLRQEHSDQLADILVKIAKDPSLRGPTSEELQRIENLYVNDPR